MQTLMFFLKKLVERHSFLDPDLLHLYARLYGARADDLLDNVASSDALGQQFGEFLVELEARYLVRNEWAKASEDILTRRTKHAIQMTEIQVNAFADWMAREYP